MVFRNDLRVDEYTVAEGINLGLAFSDDGVYWKVEPKPCLDMHNDEFINTYDPRLMVMDGRCYMTFAMETKHGVRGVIAVTDDFHKYEILSIAAPDNRNFVIFTERFGGKYVRLERPFPIYGRPGYPERFDIWISDSPDLVYWGNSDLLLGVEHVPFSNQKIGAGPPPVKTPKGWLTIFHASDFDAARGRDGYEHTWKKRYSAGVMLLDLKNPRRVAAMSKKPLLVAEAPYETTGGYRNHVVFPTGAILEDSGEVKIYYGAADTTMCLATANVDDLLSLCDTPR
jgi:beta-1,4-mannooligosaccharide/beta-1,4-mannosyl-N-acetylglucosamine phosphorylase